MKIVSRISLIVAVLCFSFLVASAQEQSFTEKYKEEVVKKLSELMNDYYVLPDVAKKTETNLLKQLKEGHFKQFKNDETFAAALTESVQSINKDKHMRIWKNQPYEAPDNSPERLIEEKLFQIDRSRRSNSGFNTVKVMEGNVGYLDLRGFCWFSRSKRDNRFLHEVNV